MRCMGCMEKYDSGDICPICGFKEGTKAEDVMYLNPGTELAERYELGRVLGSGGFGITYIAWDNILEKKVAIKEYLPSEFSTRIPGCTEITIYAGAKGIAFREGLLKFVVEARQLSDFVKVDGIVKIEDCFEENSTAYIVMEYLEGETLEEKLKREGKMDADKVVELMSPIMEALVVVHEKGIIHRDIAPDNIYITKDNKAKLLDFGSARSADSFVNESRTVIVKKGYSPEEQYASRTIQTSATDVYAMAATMYRAITGEMPPDALERRMNIQKKKKDLLISISKIGNKVTSTIELALLQALEVDQDKRIQNMKQFIKKLDAVKDKKNITKQDNDKEKNSNELSIIKQYLVKNKLATVLIIGVLGCCILLGILSMSGVLKHLGKNKKVDEITSGEVNSPNNNDTLEGEWLVNEITTEDGTVLDIQSGESAKNENLEQSNNNLDDFQGKSQTSNKTNTSGKVNIDTSGSVTTNESVDTTETNSVVTSSNSGRSDGTSSSTSSSVFKYTVSGNSVTITGYSGSATKIEIPSEIDGYKVIGIGGGTFNNDKAITKVYIPATVTSINGSTSISSGKCPFYGCSIDMKIYCEASEQPSTWGSNWNSTSSENISPTFYGVNKNGDKYVQDISKAQFTYTTDDSAKTISITGCNSGLVQLIINDYYIINKTIYSVTSIDDSIDESTSVLSASCSTLEKVILPDTLITIGRYAFGSDNGFQCSNLKVINIPNNVTLIKPYAFEECQSLESIIIGKSVREIGGGAFRACKSLKYVYIPETVLTIGVDNWGFDVLGTAPFYNDLALICIYCESEEAKTEWHKYWNAKTGEFAGTTINSYHNVKYSYTYSQYLQEIES